MLLFLSTLSLRRATQRPYVRDSKTGNFYPRSPCGERHSAARSSVMGRIFLSTLSLRRATHWQMGHSLARQFLSTLSLRRATQSGALPQPPPHISIHALLAESDDKRIVKRGADIAFLSTLSLRRATIFCSTSVKVCPYFYPRSPCGERPKISTNDLPALRISIHALLAESDYAYSLVQGKHYAFLSTLSLRRATYYGRLCYEELQFLSTLSLRRATASTIG